MQLSDASFVVLDVETTGMSAATHRITEIAMLRVEGGKITERFESLINPEQYIPPFIAEYTGITNAMIFGKPTFRELAPELSKFVRESGASPVIVGHNVRFDHGFLTESYKKAGDLLFSAPEVNHYLTLCTCKLALRMLPKLQRRTLKHVSDYFGIKIKARHRAMGDAEATAKVLLHFLEMAEDELECEALEDLLRLQNKKTPPAKPRSKQFTSLKDQVHEFPERPGVYIMRDSRKQVLYVGKANDLRERVGGYFSTSSMAQSSKHARMMKAVREITYEETGSELSALLRESLTIKALKPRFNTLERRFKSSCFLRIDVQNLFPRLDSVREPASDGAEYYGPFRSRKSVEALIEVLNRSFQLRECGDEFRVKKGSKPCFYYDIGRCGAPCAGIQSSEDYGSEVDRLRKFLSSGEAGILSLVKQMMENASDRLDFEEAQYLKLRFEEMKKVFGTGDRPFAAINANDYVILLPNTSGQAEIYFVRYGRLAKQVVVGSDQLLKSADWFRKQIRNYYSESIPAIPPECGKAEVDEMRILAGWSERQKRNGCSIVYLGAKDDAMIRELVAALTDVLKVEIRIPTAAKPIITTKKKVAKDFMFTPETVQTAKRLTLKPMTLRK
jgi:DNA polymerase-3 subunit epsilon